MSCPTCGTGLNLKRLSMAELFDAGVGGVSANLLIQSAQADALKEHFTQSPSCVPATFVHDSFVIDEHLDSNDNEW